LPEAQSACSRCIATSEIWPGGESVGGMARMLEPAPEVSIVKELPPQVEPSESIVIRPAVVASPTVTLDPPVTLSETHPVGSRSHRAGTRRSWAWICRTTAEASMSKVSRPRIPPNTESNVWSTSTRSRSQGTPSVTRSPVGTSPSLIVASGTGKVIETSKAPPVPPSVTVTGEVVGPHAAGRLVQGTVKPAGRPSMFTRR
jgi:hypothetical protein